jgi:four helix bundle protein
MKYKKFEELPIWQESLKITKLIYDLSGNSKWRKDFKLRDQIRGAMIGVSSCIVEGFEKNNNNEFIRFLRMSKGSTGEVRNQLHIGLIADYITLEEFNQLNQKLEVLGSQIGGFIVYLDNFRKSQKNKSKYEIR